MGGAPSSLLPSQGLHSWLHQPPLAKVLKGKLQQPGGWGVGGGVISPWHNFTFSAAPSPFPLASPQLLHRSSGPSTPYLITAQASGSLLPPIFSHLLIPDAP